MAAAGIAGRDLGRHLGRHLEAREVSLRSVGGVVRLMEMPLQERPRERLLRTGPDALREAELVALVLRTGDGRQDALALARALLRRFGGLNGMLCQSAERLLEVHGLGASKVAALLAMRELLKRAELARVKKRKCSLQPTTLGRYVSLRMARHKREVFGIVLLNSRLRFIAAEEVFFGTIDRASVHPREVVGRCLHYNAAAVVLYHNHPSGDPRPSETDKQITERLIKVLSEIGVKVVDHIIVGAMRHVSMAKLGLIDAED